RTAPSGNAPVSRKRHRAMSHLRATAINAHAPPALSSAPKALLQPATQGPLRLIPDPTPGQLRGHPAHMPVARLGDTLFPRPRATVIRRRRYACQAAYLATRLQLAPGKKCHHQQPGPIDPDAFALPQLPHLLDAGLWRGV